MLTLFRPCPVGQVDHRTKKHHHSLLYKIHAFSQRHYELLQFAQPCCRFSVWRVLSIFHCPTFHSTTRASNKRRASVMVGSSSAPARTRIAHSRFETGLWNFTAGALGTARTPFSQSFSFSTSRSRFSVC